MRVKNRIYLLALLLLAVGCSQDPALKSSVEGDSDSTPRAMIVNSPTGARSGEILVKFRATASAALDEVTPAATRSGRVQLTRTGIESVDERLDDAGVVQLKRVFPINSLREELTRENSLHLWYVVEFDESLSIEEVAENLAQSSQIELVEFSRTIDLAYDRNSARRATSQPTMVAAASVTAPFNDPDYSLQWHLNNDGSIPAYKNIEGGGADINAEAAWEKETGSSEIIVAVLDEGVYYEHPDLAANMWVNESESIASQTDADGNGYAGDRHGYNFVYDKGIITSDKSGDTGHGTHVAGLIAAVNGNGVGISSIAGGSGSGDGVRIMACQIIDGYNVVTVYEEAQAIKYAADNGAVILQCSWGINSGAASYPTYSGYETDEDWMLGSSLEKEALDYFIHNAGSSSGVLDGGIAIFAGGNEYAPMAGYPARYEDYVSVAALAADYTPASYTNYESRISVSAPGGDADYHLADDGSIYSLVAPTPDYGYMLYDYMDGTSMACPQVSGVVALALSRAARLKLHFKAEAFIDLLKASTSSIEEYLTGIKTYAYYYSGDEDKNLEQIDLTRYRGKVGTGLVDARALIDMVEGAGSPMKVPNYTIAVGESRSDDLAQYFVGGESLSYAATSSSSDVVKVSISGTELLLEGVAVGSTTVDITIDGEVQSITVIVREVNSGWL